MALSCTFPCETSFDYSIQLKANQLSCMIDADNDRTIALYEGSETSTDVGCDNSSQARITFSDHESDDQSLDQVSGWAKAEFLNRIGFSSLNALDSSGKSALHKAAKEGNAEMLGALLDDEDFQHVNAKDKSIFKWTVLHEASNAGNLEIVKMLLDHYRFTNGNARDRNGRTCLHFAAEHGRLEMVNAILGHPRFASIGVKDHLGFTAQQRAQTSGHNAIANCIQNYVPSYQPPGLGIEYSKDC